MAEPESAPRSTPTEYLALERAAATKSEYLDGEIFAIPLRRGVSRSFVRNRYIVSGRPMIAPLNRARDLQGRGKP